MIKDNEKYVQSSITLDEGIFLNRKNNQDTIGIINRSLKQL